MESWAKSLEHQKLAYRNWFSNALQDEGGEPHSSGGHSSFNPLTWRLLDRILGENNLISYQTFDVAPRFISEDLLYDSRSKNVVRSVGSLSTPFLLFFFCQ